MATMTSFCRITGHARNLPKPCYFPLLPPISPADAKKLCRITGKAHFSHQYSPIIAYGKPIKYDGVIGCRITKHEDFSFLRIAPFKNKENNKHYKFYKELIKNIKTRKKRTTSSSKSYVYSLTDERKNIILPPTIEEAIRVGEVEYLSLSSDSKHIAIKVKQGILIKVDVENVDQDEIDKLDNLHYGEGQSSDVLTEQQKGIEAKKRKKLETSAKRKLFEEKDKKAEEDEIKSKSVIRSKRPKIVFDAKKRQRKRQLLETLLAEEKYNKAILPPRSKVDSDSTSDSDESLMYQQMFSDVVIAQAYAQKVNVIGSPDFNTLTAEKAEEMGFSWDDFSHEEDIEAVDIKTEDCEPSNIIPPENVHALDIVAVVERIEPVTQMQPELARQISNLDSKQLSASRNVADRMKDMNATKLLPTINQINAVSQKNLVDLTPGVLVAREEEYEFIKQEECTEVELDAIPGVLVAIENEMKFVSGQIIHLQDQETFVAGQTVQTSDGERFIPGQTIVMTDGKISFIPGTVVSNRQNDTRFTTGRIIEKGNNWEFKPGQLVNLGEQEEIFAAGQTVMTDEGPKFVPGETVSDEEGNQDFVPGISVNLGKNKKFIPGQVFQSENEIKVAPGQIVSTYEGPSFVLGASVETPDGGKKFLQCTTSETKDGHLTFERQESQIPLIREHLVIPTRDLHVLVEPQREVIGFDVNPSNTVGLKPGDKLYGDIVEMDDSVLFYLTGKMPKDLDPSAKIISGELRVNEKAQRFIPGKKQLSPSGERFVPGQVVVTDHGEEFVPGQIVETSDGPKFIPGQVIQTAEGEKFVPGQVIIQEDGAKFVPGQIIQTENGATFIPGQMMNTDEGRKFVPGQLIDTKEGPMFVPGQVLETMEGPKFVPGIVVETDEGLKYVPSETDDQDDDIEFSFQGFDMTPEELILLSQSVDNANRHEPVTGQKGLIDSSTLKKLASDNIVVHGKTPEPTTEDKPKTKKYVGFMQSEEESDEEPEDHDTEKITILKSLLKAETTVSNLRKEKEYKKMLNIIGDTAEYEDQSAAVIGLTYLLQTSTDNGHIFKAFIGNDEELVGEIMSLISNADNLERNDQVKKLIHNSLRSIVNKKCNKEINEMMSTLSTDPNNPFSDPRTQILLTEAVGIVCLTGNVEAAKLLEQVISEPTDPQTLCENKDIMNVLKQLLVLHEIAERDPTVAEILLELRTNPEGIDDKSKVLEIIKKASKLLKKEEEERTKPFDIRHVASSKDIPTEIFEQLKDDKDQAEKFIEELPDELFYAIMGDNRCGEKLLDSLDSPKMTKSMRELEKFKKGMAIVVTKENMQAVIPRHYARSVCYGIIPYILIDEEGFKFFERGLTGRKLASPKIIENTWYDDGYGTGYFPQRISSSGQQYSMMFLGQNFNQPSLQYTSLLPSSGPTRLAYPSASRRSSRENSLAPIRPPSRSATPSRRSSVASFYEPSFINNNHEPYSRRNSISSNTGSIYRAMSPIDTTALERDYLREVNPESALVPYVNDEDDEDEITSPVVKSDTVANLLDKYTNFSVEKEFSRPVIGSKHSNKDSSYMEYSDDEDSYYSGRPGFPLGGRGRRSLATPERGYANIKTNGRNRGSKDFKIDDEIKTRENRKLTRPFSDIFEVDELESPTGDKTFVPKNLPVSNKKLSPKKKSKSKKNKAVSENGHSNPRKQRDSVSPLSEDDDLRLYQITRPGRTRFKSIPPVGVNFDGRSRLLSEPRHITNCVVDTSPVRGIRSRSYGADLSPLRYKPKKSNKKGISRYKGLNDDDSDDGIDCYDPYKSSYLTRTMPNPVEDDWEERPSYKLLGKHYGRPYGGFGGGGGAGGHRRYTSPLPLNPCNDISSQYTGGMSNYGMNSPYQGGMNMSPYGNMRPYGQQMGAYNPGLSPYSTGMNNYGANNFHQPLGGMSPYGYGNSSYGGNSFQRHHSYDGSNYTPVSHNTRDYQSFTGGGYQPLIRNGVNGSSFGASEINPQYGMKNGSTSGYNMSGNVGGIVMPPRSKPIDPKKYLLDDEDDMNNDSDIHLNLPQIKRFDASKYLNNDTDDISDDEAQFNGTDDYDYDLDSRDEQRKRASSIAKKYMRSFSLERDKEEDDDESSS